MFRVMVFVFPKLRVMEPGLPGDGWTPAHGQWGMNFLFCFSCA